MDNDFTSISETFLNSKDDAATPPELDISALDYEIDLISDPKIRKFVRYLLSHAPVFWKAPATLVPDIHPPDEETAGGLLLHTKRTVRVAVLLSTTFDISSQTEVDYLIAAALLHDVTKFIYDDKAEQFLFDPMHPYTIDRYVEWSIEECLTGNASGDTTIEADADAIVSILRLIRCSHGIWSPIPETVPTTILERALHESDLIASNLHVLCDGNEVKRDKWM